MASLFDIPEADVTAAEVLLIAALRAAYPSMDLRRGTVFRDLLLRPMAQLHARSLASLDELVAGRSISELAANPDALDADVNAILANFNTKLRAGVPAAGTAIVRVTSGSTIVLQSTFSLTSAGGLVYTMALPTTRTVAAGGVDIDLIAGDAAGSYYYFLLDVVAGGTGTDYDIPSGTALIVDSAQLAGVISAEAYTAIGNGRASETASEALTRLPATIAARAPVSAAGIEAWLTDAAHGNLQELRAISVVGAGSVMQRRGRANALGIAVPGRVDAYLRTFGPPVYAIVRKTGTRSGANSYTCALTETDAPGLLFIAAITTTAGTSAETLAAGGSLPFTPTPYYAGADNLLHDMDADDPSTYVGTVYQGTNLLVSDVDVDAPTVPLYIVICLAPRLAEMQAFVDSDARRPFYDLVLRAPRVAMVEVKATVTTGAGFTAAAARQVVADAINATGFTGVLEGASIIKALLAAGVTNVALGASGAGGLALSASLSTTSGDLRVLSGSTLRMSPLYEPEELLHSESCVFATTPDRVSLTVRGTT